MNVHMPHCAYEKSVNFQESILIFYQVGPNQGSHLVVCLFDKYLHPLSSLAGPRYRCKLLDHTNIKSTLGQEAEPATSW